MVVTAASRLCTTSSSPVFMSLDIRGQGLVNSKVAACATNDFVQGVCVNELEAVAKSVLLANHRMNRHGSGWKRELQLHHPTYGSFECQHGCNPRFANVHGAAL